MLADLLNTKDGTITITVIFDLSADELVRGSFQKRQKWKPIQCADQINVERAARDASPTKELK